MAENVALRANQQKALRALLSEPSIRKAAAACGLCERTLHRYLDDANFKRELRQRQDAILAATSAGLVGLSGEAVSALRDIVQDEEASASVKVRAALGWLRHTREAVELDSLAERVTALEQAAGAKR